MKRICVWLNTNSNIVEGKADLCEIISLGGEVLGEKIGQYRLIDQKKLKKKTNPSELLRVISEISVFVEKDKTATVLQSFANACTAEYGVGTVVLAPPILTTAGILVNYSRVERIFSEEKSYITEYPEKNSLFLKITVE